MMIRFFYACLLCLHPRRFRQRFGEEMLSIFDQAAADGAGMLLADAFLSMLRQWALRLEFWGTPAVTGPVAPCFDGVPVFYTCGSYRPRAAALLNGVALSIATFGAVCFAIGHGGSHHVFPAPMAGSRYVSDWSPPSLSGSGAPIRDLASAHSGGRWLRLLSFAASAFSHSQSQPLPPKTLAPNAASHFRTSERSRANKAAGQSASVYFRANRLLAALDADHDFVISASEIAGAPTALRRLDTNHDSKLSPEECGQDDPEPAVPALFSALDADHNGEISATEIQNASAALRTLDHNGDGKLTLDEILPAGMPR